MDLLVLGNFCIDRKNQDEPINLAFWTFAFDVRSADMPMTFVPPRFTALGMTAKMRDHLVGD